MTKSVVIDVDDLSLAYEIYTKPSDMLKEALFGGVRHDRFWALRGVNLKIFEGDRVGIIGPNGAGKSTLLQTIAGRLTPTSGRIIVDGRISSLLSLVPAWNADETGLENIRFNLMLQGIDAQRIPQLSEDIIDFTDLGPFIYQPVKTYSTGMSARLSFAIATAIDPEILIVDEVLGAGDGYFAGRAARRMQEMCKRGKALLFVSHATAAVRLMCETCLWLENGEVRLHGPVESVLRQYEEDMLRQQDETLREGNRRRRDATRAMLASEDIDNAELIRLRIRAESDDPRVTETHYIRGVNVAIDDVSVNIPLSAVDLRHVEIQAALDLESCEWGRLFDRQGTECRMLLPRTGVKSGGHICVKPPNSVTSPKQTLVVSFDVASMTSREKLCVDVVDLTAADWKRLGVVSRTPLAGDWARIVTRGDVAPPQQSAAKRARSLAAAQTAKPVEILGVDLLVDGRPSLSVAELVPFEVRVRINTRESLPGVSVNLNIIRSDGAYVFFQPSGLEDRNIVGHVGKAEVVFHFDPNPFGAGDYEINVFATNAFEWLNCPPSDIYDRRIAAVLFKVNLARPISFGLLNFIVPVSISLKSIRNNSDEPVPALAAPPDA